LRETAHARGRSERPVDDDAVGLGIFLADGLCRLIFRASVAGEGRFAIRELDHHVAVAGASFHGLECAAPHDEAAPNFSKAGRAAAR